MKNFKLGSQLIETRLFMRHSDTGNWGGYTYQWNAAQTAATLIKGGLITHIAPPADQDWIYPSEAQCLQCHTNAAGRSLGLETAQLNGDLTYPTTGRTANQLTTLNAIGMFTTPLTQPPSALPAYPNPYGSTGTVARTGARLPAHQLLAMPSTVGRHAVQHGSAFQHRDRIDRHLQRCAEQR